MNNITPNTPKRNRMLKHLKLPLFIVLGLVFNYAFAIGGAATSMVTQVCDFARAVTGFAGPIAFVCIAMIGLSVFLKKYQALSGIFPIMVGVGITGLALTIVTSLSSAVGLTAGC